MEEKMGYSPELQYADPRAGDQPVFVADIRRAKNELGWEPQVTVEAGIEQMHQWLKDNRDDVTKVFNS
jgi:CDP-paratose 2-epimerase